MWEVLSILGLSSLSFLLARESLWCLNVWRKRRSLSLDFARYQAPAKDLYWRGQYEMLNARASRKVRWNESDALIYEVLKRRLS